MTRAEYLAMLERNAARPEWQPPLQEIAGRPPNRQLTSPGRLVELERGRSGTVAIENNDPLVNEFGVYVNVEPETIALLDNFDAGGVLFGVTMFIALGFDSTQVNYYRPVRFNRGLPIPLVGIAVPVHAQRATVQLERSNDATATGTVLLSVLIIPRLPGPTRIPFSGSVDSGAEFQLDIPAMSRSFRLLTDISPGDTLFFRDPAEAIVGTYTVGAEMLLRPIPIQPDAVKIGYFTTSLAAKSITIEFETMF